ncbi:MULTISPECIES: WXG100 family type VII secretion target [unclassified Streptomyces]|uniref:WXG100 family type VII secretion target n=1 Tax=unclassified Streptomyces TaxID=2593676 RepID=UPI002E2CF30D|nr:WXG100 family type VII secretion target [Streptomyces sp. NBC_01429]
MSDDGTMIVKYSSLDEAAGSIRTQAGKLQNSLDAIKAKIESISQLWEGEAREAYNAGQKQWNDDAAEIQRNLTDIATAVEQAGTSYRSGDKKAAANFM